PPSSSWSPSPDDRRAAPRGAVSPTVARLGSTHGPGAEEPTQVDRVRRGRRGGRRDRRGRAQGGARRRRRRDPRRDRRRPRDQRRGLREVLHPKGWPVTDPRLPAAYLMPGSSSFSDFLAEQAPDLLPSRRAVPSGNAGDLAPHG